MRRMIPNTGANMAALRGSSTYNSTEAIAASSSSARVNYLLPGLQLNAALLKTDAPMLFEKTLSSGAQAPRVELIESDSAASEVFPPLPAPPGDISVGGRRTESSIRGMRAARQSPNDRSSAYLKDLISTAMLLT